MLLFRQHLVTGCVSDITNSSNKTKIIDRVRRMCTVFDRICIIVEKDPTKSWEKDAAVKPLWEWTLSLITCMFVYNRFWQFAKLTIWHQNY